MFILKIKYMLYNFVKKKRYLEMARNEVNDLNQSVSNPYIHHHHRRKSCRYEQFCVKLFITDAESTSDVIFDTGCLHQRRDSSISLEKIPLLG